MVAPTRAAILLLGCLLIPVAHTAFAQTQTSGGVTGTITDPTDAAVSGAEVTLVNQATGHKRSGLSDAQGNFAFPFLPVGRYRLRISAKGFTDETINDISVVVTETKRVNASLKVGPTEDKVAVHGGLIQADGPQLGRVVDSRSLSELPLATRNYTQILWLSTGVSASLPDNTAVGRNSQNIVVNGTRPGQNNFQLNGADANIVGVVDAGSIAVPAPETIQEFKIQTSLYDASFGRSGGNIQIVTRSGGNEIHGGVYDYFRNDLLNANNAVLKATNAKRPVLERNVFGGTLAGPVRKEKAFYFLSYQGTHEENGASPNSLSSNVLIAPGLTADRSEATLRRTFNVASIHPTALALLNVTLPDGSFLIPTPQSNGRYSGSAPSSYLEDQFNTNLDYRWSERDSLSAKVFFSNAPSTLALFSGPNVPGFTAERDVNNRVISLQHVHTFDSTVINEARVGYSFIRTSTVPREPVKDSDVGIYRANAATLPGLGLIRIAPTSGGVAFGTAVVQIDVQSATHTTTAADTLSIARGKHFARLGAEVMYFQNNIAANLNSRGQIDFSSFEDFLRGIPSRSVFGTGINYRSLRATGYRFFIQDDWRLSRKLMLNLGLRYDLELPAFDTRGRLSTFDPELYEPRRVAAGSTPKGPPMSGFVQAGNVIPTYDLPDVPNVSTRMVRNVDANNLGPRVGIVLLPLSSGRLVLRSGYGMFHSWLSTFHLTAAIQLPPNYVVGERPAPPLDNPYFAAPPEEAFPTFVPGIDLTNQVFGRDLRSPYVHQYIASVQYALKSDLLLEIAFAGTRGLNLWRNVAINQASLASPEKPIINAANEQVITTNSAGNAQLRAPFQGALINGFGQRQTTAQSSYHSLQASLGKQVSRGLQFLISYTYAKSIDNASTGATGMDSAFILGNQHDGRANRGVSDYDLTHRLVLSYLWDLPRPAFAGRSKAARLLVADWQVTGILVAMSGLPIDIVDSGAGGFYGLSGAIALARPNYAPGATRETATTNVPPGYFFNPFAFARPIVAAGQPIPSSHGTAVAEQRGTDIGGLGRNILRGPRQTNVDLSVLKRFPLRDARAIEFRAEFFNIFNHVNLANPNGNFGAIPQGGFDPNTGLVVNPGSFGRITAASNNPRLIQLALKLSF